MISFTSGLPRDNMSNMMNLSEKKTDQGEPNRLLLKVNRQKQITTKARIKYRELNLKQLNGHLKNGTFPRRMKAIRPYPKMETEKAQAMVDAACQQVNKIILSQMIEEQTMKLKQDQDSYELLRKQQKEARQQSPKVLKRKLRENTTQPPRKSMIQSKKPVMVTVLQLQQELKDLQSKYTELCEKLAPVKPQEL